MGAFLTSLASIADQYGQAKNSADEDKRSIADKQRQLSAQDAYLKLAQSADQRAAETQEQNLQKGDLLKIGNRLWSVSKAKFIDDQKTDPLETYNKFVKTLPPDVAKGAQARFQTIYEADPGDVKGAISEGMKYVDSQQAEANRRQDQVTRENDRRTDEQKREKERREDKQESERASERLQKMMVDFRLDEKQKYMTPQDRQVFQSIKQVAPSVDRTIEYLENTKGEDGKPLKEENAYVFGDRSALMQHLRQRGYKFGTKQEDISQNLIKNAALIQVLGARPWMTMGRGKFIYETISQHLPASTDTPANMYDKLLWLRDNVLSDARDSLSDYVQPGGANKNENDPLGVLPGGQK